MNGDTLCLSIASGSLVMPDGVAESLVTKTSESPNSPPLSGQGSCSSLGLGSGLVRSTGDESQALNLFEHGQGLAQGQLLIAYVIGESAMCNLGCLTNSAESLKRTQAVTGNMPFSQSLA